MDVALVQEPYATRNSSSPGSPLELADLPEDFVAFHRFTFHEHHYGAAVLVRRRLGASLCQRASFESINSNHVAWVDVPAGQGWVSFASVYVRPAAASLDAVLTPALERIGHLGRSVLGVDANARNPLWGSPRVDAKGVELEELLACKPLHLANLPLDELSYRPSGTSFIDVTLHGSGIEVADWRYADLPSLSDHPLILFSCRLARCSQMDRNPARLPQPTGRPFRLPPLSAIDRAAFADGMRRVTSIAPQRIQNQQCIDEAAMQLAAGVQSAARVADERNHNRSAPVRPKKMPWWNDDLLDLRRRLWRAHGEWRDGGSIEKELEHSRLKKEYQCAIRRAKTISFKKFATDLGSDMRATIRALEPSRGKGPTLPSRVVVGDVETTDQVEILRACAGHFFPSDPSGSQATEPTMQAATDAMNQTESSGELRPPVTREEVTAALSALKQDSAPGPDGISAAAIQIAPIELASRLRVIYDACLDMGHFPKCWRHARVTIIPKPGKTDYSSLSSFRQSV